MKKSYVALISGGLFSLAISPVISEFSISYAEDAGWLDNTKQHVDGFFWSLVQSAAVIGGQAWYTHSLAALAGFVLGWVGLLIYQRLQAPLNAQVVIEDPASAAKDARALYTSVTSMKLHVDNYMHAYERGRANRMIFGKLVSEWQAAQLDLTKRGFTTPDLAEKTDGETGEILTIYLDGLIPLIRAKHIPEAIAKSQQLSVDLA